MLDSFFQIGPLPSNQLIGTYNPYLVYLSYLVAVIASYIALDLSTRLREINNTKLSEVLWLIGGSFAMGLGIWSMHFIGMLSFNMPMKMDYDPTITLISMSIAIFASALALLLIKSRTIKRNQLITGGIILGLGIASMHYTGMAAMSNSMGIRYLPNYFILSIIIAIVASEAALYLSLLSSQASVKYQTRLKIFSALIMGAAICGMHYMGMFAAVFTPLVNHSHVNHETLNHNYLSIAIAIVTLIIFSISVISTYYKKIVDAQLLVARQAGMAEVATSILHNVGNVLNSVKLSIEVFKEKIDSDNINKLNELALMIEENKNNLANFLSQDSKGRYLAECLAIILPKFIEDFKIISLEIHELRQNIGHIEDIVSMQQIISGLVQQSVQRTSIHKVLERALSICQIQNSSNSPNPPIIIEKQYDDKLYVIADESKVLQILVNLIKNATEALYMCIENESKRITINATKNNESYAEIKITDNGIGISEKNQTKIFAQGFTTKFSGHGVGLHNSANSAKTMGGKLEVKSLGHKKGCTFILTLPIADLLV